MARQPGSALARNQSSRVGNTVHDVAPLPKALPARSTQDNDEVEVQGGRVYLHLGARRDDAESR
jgi:hypothetical protein